METRLKSAVILTNPKYPHNVGAVIRACAAYGVPELRYTGSRMDRELAKWDRVPREERMKGYQTVNWRQSNRPFDEFPDLVPIAVEVRPNMEMLPQFIHPENALYVFGPEDGSIPSVLLRHCHRFVAIPSLHCLNLAMAVGTVLYDRQAKLQPERRMDMSITEGRGWILDDESL